MRIHGELAFIKRKQQNQGEKFNYFLWKNVRSHRWIQKKLFVGQNFIYNIFPKKYLHTFMTKKMLKNSCFYKL